MKMIPLKTTKLFQLLLASATLVACGDDGTVPGDTTEGDTDDDDTETNETVSATSPSTSVTTTSPSTSSPSTTATESDTDPTTTGDTETPTTTGDTEEPTTTGDTETTMEPTTTGDTEPTTTGDTEEPTTTGLLECVDENLGTGAPINVTGDSTGSGDEIVPSCADGGGEEYVFEYTTAEAGYYGINTVGSEYDTSLILLDGCGGSEIACNDDALGGVQSQVVADLAADTTYVVAVDSYDGDVGAFSVNLDYLGDTALPAQFCDAAGAALVECTEVGDGTLTYTGSLDCGSFVSFFDVFELDVTEGDCLHITVDNIDPAVGATGNPAADPQFFLVDANGDISGFDDDIPCTDPTWDGDYGCPEANVVASSTGTMLLLLRNYGGDGCPDDAPHSLDIAINGLDIDPAGLTVSDSLVGQCPI